MSGASLVFSIIGACISVGGVFIAIGVLKGKIQQNTEINNAQNEQMKKFASRDDLATAIQRSDELLALIKARAEEDRSKGQGQYREFSALLNAQDKRIIAIETQQTVFAKILDEMKQDFKSGLKEIQVELKELHNEIKQSRKQG